MKTIFVVHLTYLIVIGQMQHYCDAGLLDLLWHRSGRNPHLYNFNNNINRNDNNQVGFLTQNKSPVPVRERNNWLVNNPLENDDTSQNEATNLSSNNFVPYITKEGPQTSNDYNTNEDIKIEVSPANSINNNNIQNVAVDTPDIKEHRVEHNFKSSQGNNVASNLNIPKIVDDLNRINNIVTKINKERQKESENQTPHIKANADEKPTLPSLSNFQIQPIAILTIPKANNQNTNQNGNKASNSNINYQPSNPIQRPLHHNSSLSQIPSQIYDENDSSHNNPIESSNTENNNDYEQDHKSKNEENQEEDTAKGDHKIKVLKPLTKRKFFVQVEPVIPEYKETAHNQTVYYVNA
ncbi:unnamed protein product, partial [Leptidea sinapis]